MAAAGMPELSLRVERADEARLAWAFGLSLALHLLVLGTYQTGKQLGWWQNWRLPAWMQSVRLLTQLLEKPQPKPQPPQEVPLIFVDVSSAQASLEPPKNARYYSDKNSTAANQDPTENSTVPKINGEDTHIVKTEDVPRNKAFPLNPAPPQPQSPPEPPPPAQDPKPKPAFTPGDLALAKPEDTTRKDPGSAEERPRPRNLQEARARQPESTRSGRKMKQEGGVRQQGDPHLNVVATGFGAYDAALIAAVQNRWYDLLDSRNWAAYDTGQVTVRFVLHSDGSISEMRLGDYTVAYTLALLCQSAIKDPAPYAPWPSDMKSKIGGDDREITFTFFYY